MYIMRSLLVVVCFLQCDYSDVEMLSSVDESVVLSCKPNVNESVTWRMRKPLENASTNVIVGNYVEVAYRAYASLLVFYHYVNLLLHSVSLENACVDEHAPIMLPVVQTVTGDAANLTYAENSGEYGWWHLSECWCVRQRGSLLQAYCRVVHYTTYLLVYVVLLLSWDVVFLRTVCGIVAVA